MSTPAPKPATAKPRTSLLARVFGRIGGRRGQRIEVRVAPLGGAEAGPDDTERLLQALDGRLGLRARPLGRPFAVEPTLDEAQALAAAADAGRRQLAPVGADVFVWGEIPAPGTTVHLRFVPAVPPNEYLAGSGAPGLMLELPAALDGGLDVLPPLAALAAATPRLAVQAGAWQVALARAIEMALPTVDAPPAELTARERTSVQACVADALARLAQHTGDAALVDEAVARYRAALARMTAEETPLAFAFAEKSLGLLLLAQAEGGDDTEVLDAAVAALRAALVPLRRETMPQPWAATQNRLGQALYKLDARSGDSELLKQCVAAYQSALQVYTRAEAPGIWAEILHNLAQAAQVLGEQVQSPELIRKAIDACRSALAVRTRDAAPLLWAATQNNLGSALFLLAKHEGDAEALEQAAAAFAEAEALYVEKRAEALASIAAKNRARVEDHARRRAPRPAAEPL